MIHRPRYDDWSFPKGPTLKRGESDEEAALREVEEEVGIPASSARSWPARALATRRGARRPSATGRSSSAGAEPIAGDGVDQWRWAPLEEAAKELTWGRDRQVLDSLRELHEPAPHPPRARRRDRGTSGKETIVSDRWTASLVARRRLWSTRWRSSISTGSSRAPTTAASRRSGPLAEARGNRDRARREARSGQAPRRARRFSSALRVRTRPSARTAISRGSATGTFEKGSTWILEDRLEQGPLHPTAGLSGGPAPLRRAREPPLLGGLRARPRAARPGAAAPRRVQGLRPASSARARAGLCAARRCRQRSVFRSTGWSPARACSGPSVRPARRLHRARGASCCEGDPR